MTAARQERKSRHGRALRLAGLLLPLVAMAAVIAAQAATTERVVDAHVLAPVQLGAHRGGPLLERVGRATGSPCGLGARLSPCPGTLARVGGVPTDQHLPCRPECRPTSCYRHGRWCPLSAS